VQSFPEIDEDTRRFLWDPFQSYLLGPVLLVSGDVLKEEKRRRSRCLSKGGPPVVLWQQRWLVLQQNLLLEYGSSQTNIRPIGYLCLEGCSLTPLPSDPTALTIRGLYKASYTKGKANLHHAIIKTASRHDTLNWMQLLQEASGLCLGDLYSIEQDSSPDSSKCLGKGRFAEVRKARRRRYAWPVAETTGLRRSFRSDHSEDSSYSRDSRRLSGDSSQNSNLHETPQCALKVVDKQEFWKRVIAGQERSDTLAREVQTQVVLTQKALQEGGFGRHIALLFNVFETSSNFILETELLSGCDLFDRLSSACVLEERVAAAMLRHVLEAVSFCQGHRIAHRDIKLSNLIFPVGNVAGTSIKLADFGMAAFWDDNCKLTGRCGTPGYVAPEILKAGAKESYPNQVDLFSVGVIAYTLLCGYEPFYGMNDKQLIEANKTAEYQFHLPEWENVSEDAKDLVRKLLEKDPAKRIDVNNALQHPWLLRHSFESTASSINNEEHMVCLVV